MVSRPSATRKNSPVIGLPVPAELALDLHGPDIVFIDLAVFSAVSRADRTQLYASVRPRCYHGVMTTIRAEEVRIPRHAREAVARHERVVVVNHERPAFVIMHPDDTAADPPIARRGRPLREALGLLAGAALPDPGFADDMEAVLADVGPAPDDPWARS
jgi:hypothetical protein